MPQETSSSKQDKLQELVSSEPLNPSDFEIPFTATTTSLEPQRKPAGKPSVKTKKHVTTRKRVVSPSLGTVTIVTH